MNTNNNNWWREGILVFSEISGWIATPVILALITGKALDRHYNTTPYIFLTFALLGFLISSWGILKVVKRFAKKADVDFGFKK